MSPQKQNVILLYPKTGMDFGSTIAPPHALLAVAAPLVKAGYSVAILDQRLERISEETLAKYISSELLCVGISSMTGTQIKHALKIAALIRRLTSGKVPIVWGGTHPTILAEQTAQHEMADMVVVGEGEETFLELVNHLAAKTRLDGIAGLVYKDGTTVVSNLPRPLVDMETLLPTPWELVDAEKYIHRDMYVKDRRRVLDIGQTSRGCPFMCGFCSSASIRGRKWRPMSAEKSLDMIIGTIRRFNLDGFWLRDDEFYINRRRADTICRGIIDAKLNVSFYTSGTRVDVFLKSTEDELKTLRQSGAHTLKFGAESGSQRILDLMGKGIRTEQTFEVNRRCRQLGIIPVYSFVIGFPTETFADIDMTIDMINRLRRENPQAQFETVAQYTALPGTPTFEMAIQHGLRPPQSLAEWSEWIFDDYDLAGDKLPWFSRRERIAIAHVSYMSILANALGNAVDSVSNRPLRQALRLLAGPTSIYFRFRLSRKRYHIAPEMALIRYLRRKLFYESELTIH